jgi:hypothetical protein
MSNSALDQLESVFPELIVLMPPQFDSHEFILALAQRYQPAYVRALAAYTHKDSPFMIVHGEIARRLLNYPALVRKVGEQNSEDIFRQLDSAVLWRKELATSS